MLRRIHLRIRQYGIRMGSILILPTTPLRGKSTLTY
nr:MAG TPA: Metallophosphoesterase repair, P-loop phosphotransferase, polynucleotide [Caudoviricetes sp.]DAJ70888.1 MAG TPA: Metallophosphoesterase repair, P-loop phosphotransferase, polynucleotide [Caudoviricetes sp.]